MLTEGFRMYARMLPVLLERCEADRPSLVVTDVRGAPSSTIQTSGPIALFREELQGWRACVCTPSRVAPPVRRHQLQPGGCTYALTVSRPTHAPAYVVDCMAYFLDWLQLGVRVRVRVGVRVGVKGLG